MRKNERAKNKRRHKAEQRKAYMHPYKQRAYKKGFKRIKRSIGKHDTCGRKKRNKNRHGN